jgi:ParB family chromosome partitioning protein
VEEIVPNPRQPRHHFAEAALDELSQSIAAHGVAQPLLVRRLENGYELIAGERRLRASKKAGLTMVPVVIKDISDEESLELAIIENVQREDLNAIDEALSYRQLIDEFQYTQVMVAEKVGKPRSTVANLLRLLDLPEEVQLALKTNRISAGHAKALMAIEGTAEQKAAFEKLLLGEINVRETEQIAKVQKKDKPEILKPEMSFALREASQELSSYLGTKVTLSGDETRGYVNIHYFSKDDLERILELIKKA